jgi:hypothetical protein
MIIVVDVVQEDDFNNVESIMLNDVADSTWDSMRVYPQVSRLATWSENCKWYSSLPLSAVVSLFCESV